MTNEKHPLDGVDDTNWGRKVEARHEENIGRFERIDRRLEDFDERMRASEKDRVSMRAELTANTEVTRSIKRDTEAIVGFARGMSALKRFLIWAVPIACSIVSAYVAWTIKK